MTPRAAAVAGVLFALLFGATLILIRVKMPVGVGDSAEWLDSQKDGISTATKLMPFAGITFLWFIGVVRDNLGPSLSPLKPNRLGVADAAGRSGPAAWVLDLIVVVTMNVRQTADRKTI